MPEHIRFILRHAAIGAVIAFAFVAMLLGFNLANLRHLVLNSADGVLGNGCADGVSRAKWGRRARRGATLPRLCLMV